MLLFLVGFRGGFFSGEFFFLGGAGARKPQPRRGDGSGGARAAVASRLLRRGRTRPRARRRPLPSLARDRRVRGCGAWRARRNGRERARAPQGRGERANPLSPPQKTDSTRDTAPAFANARAARRLGDIASDRPAQGRGRGLGCGSRARQAGVGRQRLERGQIESSLLRARSLLSLSLLLACNPHAPGAGAALTACSPWCPLFPLSGGAGGALFEGEGEGERRKRESLLLLASLGGWVAGGCGGDAGGPCGCIGG